VKEKETTVEKGQVISAEGEDGGMHKDDTTPIAENAPNSERKDDSPINSDNNGNEVTLNLSHFLLTIFLQTLNCFN
jgi:hypothetical protein